MQIRTGLTEPSQGLPTTLDDPWTKNGSQAITIYDSTFVIDDSSTLEQLTYQRNLHPADTIATPPRIGDTAWVAARVRIASSDPWLPQSEAPVVGIELCDGARTLAVVAGNGVLMLVDPSTAVILSEQITAPTLKPMVIEFGKIGAERWEVWLEGDKVLEIPYRLARAAPAGSGGGFIRWGSLSSGHESLSNWWTVIDSLNERVPLLLMLGRIIGALPPPIYARLSARMWAIGYATASMVSQAIYGITEAPNMLRVGRLPVDAGRYRYDGDTLPSALDPAWTDIVAGQVAVDDDRLRLKIQTGVKPHAGSDAEFPDFVANSTSYPPDVDAIEHRVRSRWQVQQYTPDAAGRVGPYMQIRDENFIVTAQLVEIDASDPSLGVGWTLTLKATVGTLALPADSIGVWRVDPYQEHDVELQVLGQSVVLLLVDGAIVDRVPYASFTDATTDRLARIAAGGATSPSPSGAFFSWAAEAERRMADLSSRSYWSQDAADHLVFIGGLERNDEVDSAKRTRRSLAAMRGTSVGLVVELRRLTGDATPQLLTYSEPASWYLEASWPDITPVYLEADGYVVTTVVEVYSIPPNFTASQFFELIRRHLLPLSTLGLRYELAVAVLTTGALSSPTSTTTRITVDDSSWFTVGDVITIRKADNSAWEQATVVAVPSATTIDVTLLGISYPTGSIVRTVVATT